MMSLKKRLDEFQGIYPVVFRLIGKSYATQITTCFLEKDWPAKDFPIFLEKAPPLKAFPYLGDVARLEWIKYQSLHTPTKRPLKSEQLYFVPEEIPPLRFIPHPSFTLFASPYPLNTIWELPELKEKINLPCESSWSLVFRPEKTVKIYWLTCELYAFFESLVEGHNLVQSLEKVLAFCPDFDFQAALHLAFENNFFVSVYLVFPKDENIVF